MQVLEGAVLIVDQRVSRDGEVRAMFANDGKSGVCIVADHRTGAPCYTLAIPNDLWPKYARGDWDENMKARHVGDLPLDNDEAQAMRYMAVLAIKVLAYSSVPQLAPQLLTTRAEQKAAGLHPKHIRTGQKTLIVRYLPRVIRDRDLTETAPTGQTHKFMGRAGHIRHYQAERFKAARGTWQWMPPIPPPDGVQVVYRIRQAPRGSVPVGPPPAPAIS